MKVKKNDTVVVLTGKDVKKTGKVTKALPKLNKIVVEGVNVQEKNRKARNAQETSTKVKQEELLYVTAVGILNKKQEYGVFYFMGVLYPFLVMLLFYIVKKCNTPDSSDI